MLTELLPRLPINDTAGLLAEMIFKETIEGDLSKKTDSLAVFTRGVRKLISSREPPYYGFFQMPRSENMRATPGPATAVTENTSGP
jgi:hypothetical protein